MIRIQIQLTDESLPALRTLARQEYRDVRQQAACIVERELERLGLLQLTQADAVVTPAQDPKPERAERLVPA